MNVMKKKFIEEVRKALKMIHRDSKLSLYDHYCLAYKKVMNNLPQSETKSGSTI